MLTAMRVYMRITVTLYVCLPLGEGVCPDCLYANRVYAQTVCMLTARRGCMPRPVTLCVC